MSRYIDADKFFVEVNKIVPCDYGTVDSYEAHNAARDVLCDILDKLDEQPTVNIQESEPQKIKHGKWVWLTQEEAKPYAPLGIVFSAENWICSECNNYKTFDVRLKPKYCDNCGAKMNDNHT